MRRLVDLVKLSRLDYLIRRQATGSPEQLADKLGLSRSTLFDFISFLKQDMGAPIRYNRNRPSYIYDYVPKFHLGFEKDRLNSTELYNTIGGIEEKPDNDDFIIDDDFSFNLDADDIGF